MIRISKDEAVIIAEILNHSWDNFLADEPTREQRIKRALYLQNLAKRLEKEGKDQRRKSNRSRNDYNDIFNRLTG